MCAASRLAVPKALPQTAQGATACASAALNGQGDWQSAVTGCIGALIPSQFNCVVAAIAASGGDKLSPTSEKSPIKERAEIWLNAHGGIPKACLDPGGARDDGSRLPRSVRGFR